MIAQDVQLIIPMSGVGRRFMEQGYRDPKPLIKVIDHPMIKHVLDIFPNTSDVIFVCNNEHLETTNMKNVLLDAHPHAKIVGIDKHKKGPVYAALKVKKLIDDDKPIIVSYCDYGTEWDYDLFLETMSTTGCQGAIPCYIGFHPHMLGADHYAYVKTQQKNALQVREKKPFTDDKMSEYASNGTYYFKTGAILKKYFERCIADNNHVNGEFYVSMVYNQMIEDGLDVKVFEIDKMLQWGTPYDLRIYQQWMRYFKNRDENPPSPVQAPEGTTLLLPMAGKGSRFELEGYGEPKPFITTDDKPMFVRALEDLPSCDCVVLGVLSEHVKEKMYKQKITQALNGSVVVEIPQVTEGQACTVEIMLREAGVDPEGPILISACDNGMYYNQAKFKQELEDQDNDVVVCSFRNNEASKNNPNMYAWLDVCDKGLIKHVSCKNFIYDDPLSTHAIIGTMFFRKAKYFLDGLKKNYAENIRTNNEFYVDDVLNQNIKSGLTVKVFEAQNYICWGTPDDYRTYNYWREHYEETK